MQDNHHAKVVRELIEHEEFNGFSGALSERAKILEAQLLTHLLVPAHLIEEVVHGDGAEHTNAIEALRRMLRDFRAGAKTKPLRVFHWVGMRSQCPTHNRQTFEIVAAPSGVAAARIAGRDRPAQLWNFSRNRNHDKMVIALSKPGTIFWTPLDDSYRRDAKWTEVAR